MWSIDEHLRQIERRLGIEINNRGNHFRLIGDGELIRAGEEVIKGLYDATEASHDTGAGASLSQESGAESMLREDAVNEMMPEVVIKPAVA